LTLLLFLFLFCSVSQCGEIRRERRSYLQGEISNLLALFKDVPGLLAPKFPMVMAALAMAKAEVTYYFIHLSVDVPKARAKIYKVEDYFDSQISYLIGAVVELVELVKRNAQGVEAYYSEYLQGAHKLAVEQLVDKCKGLARGAVQDIFDSLSTTLGPGGDLDVLRLDWGRAHAVLLSNESMSVMKSPAITELVHRMRTVCLHSKFADSVHELLLQRCELDMMWYFQGNMRAFFRECLTASDDTPRHALSFLRVLSGAADAVHESCQEEQNKRGREAAKIGEEMMGELGERVKALLSGLYAQLTGLAGQVAPIEAAYRYERSEGAGPNAQAEPLAGNESKPESARNIKPLMDVQVSAVHLLWSISASEEDVVVYDHRFRPKDLVRDQVESFLRDVYRRECSATNKGPPPPAHLAKVFNVACQCIQLVSTHIDLDVGTILRRVLFDEATAGISPPYLPGSAIGTLSEKADRASQSVVLHYASFYKRLCAEAVPGGAKQAVVTPHGFLGSGMDSYTDVGEFKALYGLVGGYGMAILESDLVQLVSARAERIKAFIATNTSALHNFKQKHADPAGWEAVSVAVTRDLRGLDDFLVDACVIGNALSLRRLIAEAVRESQAMTVPFAVSSVAMAKMAIKPHAFEGSAGLAFLAQESCGLMDSTHVDQSVKVAVQALGNSTQDVQSIWSYLPYAFAASFAAETWKTTAYDSSLDGIWKSCFVIFISIKVEHQSRASKFIIKVYNSPPHFFLHFVCVFFFCNNQ
jgi:NCK-associated protein 1